MNIVYHQTNFKIVPSNVPIDSLVGHLLHCCQVHHDLACKYMSYQIAVIDLVRCSLVFTGAEEHPQELE